MDAVAVVVVAGLGMLGVERLRPHVRQPRRAHWWLRVLLLNAAQAGIVWLGARSWDRWLPQARLWDAQPVGDVAGIALGYLVITFVFYWWHRARHEVPLLWRLHQVHHSAARLELLTSFYKHPLEMLVNGLLCSAVLHLGVGLDAGPAAVVVAITGVAELAYHWNVRTPHWLGYLFQRPESHRLHHEYGVHRRNYSDLPLWDLLFGTFANPRGAAVDCGFDAAHEAQLLRMLGGREPR